jgi:hypothetical protein
MHGIVRQRSSDQSNKQPDAIIDDSGVRARSDGLPEAQNIDKLKPLEYRAILRDLVGILP